MAKSNSYHGNGTWAVRRHIKTPAMQNEADSLSVMAVVDILPGVCKALGGPSHHRLQLRSDASQVDFQRIKIELEAAGYPAAADRRSLLKKGGPLS